MIDEVMGHEAASRAGQQRGSAMGAHYRHTTPEMTGRIATAIEQRLTMVLEVAEQARTPSDWRPWRSACSPDGCSTLTTNWSCAGLINCGM